MYYTPYIFKLKHQNSNKKFSFQFGPFISTVGNNSIITRRVNNNDNRCITKDSFEPPPEHFYWVVWGEAVSLYAKVFCEGVSVCVGPGGRAARAPTPRRGRPQRCSHSVLSQRWTVPHAPLAATHNKTLGNWNLTWSAMWIEDSDFELVKWIKMPKIFLIKKRLHEQQLGLQEGQELLASKADSLCTGSPLDDGPIALLSKKDNAGKYIRFFNRINFLNLFIYVIFSIFSNNFFNRLSIILDYFYITIGNSTKTFSYLNGIPLTSSFYEFLFIASFVTATCSDKKKTRTYRIQFSTSRFSIR